MKQGDPTRWIVFWRTVFLVIQGVATLGLLALFIYRSSPTAEATRDLTKFQSLSETDLTSEVSRSLVGKVLQADVKKGERIKADMVKEPAPMIQVPQSVAAVITMKEADVTIRRLVVGMTVAVARPASSNLTGTLIGRDCSSSTCRLIVAMHGLPSGGVLDIQGFAGADVQPIPPKP